MSDNEDTRTAAINALTEICKDETVDPGHRIKAADILLNA